MLLRQVLQHLGKGCQHPSVAAGPEVLLAGSGLVFRIDVFAVAEVQARLFVVHDGVGILPVLIHLVEVLLVARQLVHLRHHWHHHVERVGPPPVVVGLRVGLEAHHLLGACHLVFGREHCVQVQIGLEADLPVAEQHVLHRLAVLLVLPLRRVLLTGALPEVAVGPLLRVVHPCHVAEREERFHVARVIDGRVPERAFLLMVHLPRVIHLVDDVAHLLRSGTSPDPCKGGERDDRCQ